VTSIVASALGVVAGVCFGVGVLHLFIAVRRPRGGTHLTFALMSLLLGGYALAAIGNYQATSVEALATATRQQLTLLLLATAVFVWFVSFYTGVRPLPFLLAMTGVYLVLLAANLTSSFGLLYSDISGLVSVLLPWGERIVLPKGTASLWQFLCVLANAAVLGFAFYASSRQYRRGERGPALALGLSTLVLVIAAFHDTLVDAQVITSMYLLEFGYLALVATMSLSLSGRVVRAEEELQAYHQHLEELVEERTAELTATSERLQREIAERLQVEETLRKSEERYRFLIEKQGVGIAIVAPDERFTFCNPMAERIFGVPPGTLVGKSLQEFTSPETFETIRKQTESRRAGEMGVYEFEIVRPDGEKRRLFTTVTPWLDGDGHFIGAFGVFRDDTERVRVEEALRESEAQLLDLYEGAPNAYFSIGTDGLIRRCNRRAGELFGYPVEELVGKPVLELYADTPQGKEKASAVFLRFMAGERVTDEELQMQKADGTPIWIGLTVNAVRDADGQVVESRSMVVDITERKRAEEELRKLSRAIEQSPGTVAITDAQGNVEYVNPKFTQLTGYTLEEVLGQNPRLLKSGEQPEEFYRELWDTILAGEEWQGEFSNRKKSGETYWELASISAIRDADGVITHFVKVAEDITERKRAEEALGQRVGELITLNRIAQTVATVTDLPAALEIVAETVTHLLDATTTVIASLHGDRMEVLAQFDRTPGSPGVVGQVFPLGDASLVHQMIEQGEPLVAPDGRGGQFPPLLRERMHAVGVRTVLVVPLRARGVIIGVMGVGTDQVDRVFTETEMALAGTIAGDVAGAIENARLYEQAQAVAIDGERRRLGRELHDSVTQSLYSLTLLTNGWGAMAEQGRLEDAPDSFRQLGDVALQALKEMRLLIHELRPTVLEEMGLVGALQQRLDTVERRVSVETRLLTQGEVDHLPRAVEEQLFHIAQEALNNALRHAEATAITVRIEAQDEQVTLFVQDDGMGFDSTLDSAGMGLTTMQERAEAIGGRVSITSAPQQGTTVEVTVAIEPGGDVQ